MNIFFDFDGTIIDIQRKYELLAYDALQTLSLRHSLPDNYWQLKRKGMSEKEIFPLLSTDEFAKYEQYRQTYTENSKYTAHDILQKGILELLNALRNHVLILATMRKDRARLLDQLEQLGITSSFVEILTPKKTNQFDKSKILQESAYLQKNMSILYGDTEVDIRAAAVLGIKIILYSKGIRSPEFLRTYSDHSPILISHQEFIKVITTIQ